MKLEIEKDKVLEAAKACPESEKVLKTLFPQIFAEDDLAIQKDAFTDYHDQDLAKFCQKAFNDPEAIQIAAGAVFCLSPERSDLRYRSLYVGNDYNVELLFTTEDHATVIVFKKRKK